MNEDNFYNRKDDIKKLLKDPGKEGAGPDGLTLRALFNELNAMRVPFFFAAAVSNSEEETEYLCETVTPNSMELTLKDDKFADFLDIRNHGFVAVPSADLTSESIQALKKLQEARDSSPFYSEDALMEFARQQNIEIVDGSVLDDGDDDDGGIGGDFPHGASRSVIESVMQHAIGEGEGGAMEEAGPGQIPVPVCHCEPLDISWGTGSTHAYGEGFAKIDERHKGILKGNGSFLQEKEREAASIGPGQPMGTCTEEDKDTQEADTDGQG